MTLEVKRDTWCRHRTPFTKEFRTCKANIDFHQFDGPHADMPCLGENAAAKARCSSYSGWTAQEIADREECVEQSLKRFGVIRAAIIAEHERTGTNAGTIPCPACGTGTVSWSRARSNGHIYARCSTPDCASWME